MLDDRAKLLLKALIERYIAEGQPVGSRTITKSRSAMRLSISGVSFVPMQFLAQRIEVGPAARVKEAHAVL